MSNRRKLRPSSAPPPAVRAASSQRRVVAAGIGVVLIGSSALAVTLARASSDPQESRHVTTSASTPDNAPPRAPVQTAGETWRAGVFKDLGLFKAGIATWQGTFERWRTGAASALEVRSSIETHFDDALSARDLLLAHTPFPGAPGVIKDYRAAIELYVEAMRIARLATSLDHADVRVQSQLLHLRVRTLGSRVFDQGSTALKPFLPVLASDPNVEVDPAPPVPNWAAVKLSAGPPLAAGAPLPAPASPAPRRQVPLGSWISAVAGLHLPSASSEFATLLHGSDQELRGLAEQLAAAVSELNTMPDPVGEPGASVRLRLGLLVKAEAARTAQVALAAPAESAGLRLSAQRLALIGDALWDPRLGPRATQLRSSLLTESSP